MSAMKQGEQVPNTAVGPSYGGSDVDPTKNVLDLVRAESLKRDELRDADKELFTTRIDALRDNIKIVSEGIVAYQNSQHDAETRRIDQLAATRQEFQNTIRDMLAESVRTTSALVGGQLLQIQATFDSRVSKLEAGAFIAAGKSSVSDPAQTESMSRLLATMAAMDVRLAALRTTESTTAGRGAGRSDMVAWTVAGIAIVGGIIGIFVSSGILHR